MGKEKQKNRMIMTDLEIQVNYRRSYRGNQQVKILAQLNACSEEKIVGILMDGGFSEQEVRSKRVMLKNGATSVYYEGRKRKG